MTKEGDDTKFKIPVTGAQRADLQKQVEALVEEAKEAQRVIAEEIASRGKKRAK